VPPPWREDVSAPCQSLSLCQLYTVFVVQAYQTSQYVVPRSGIFLGKWRSSFAGSSGGKMNVQSACAQNTRYMFTVFSVSHAYTQAHTYIYTLSVSCKSLSLSKCFHWLPLNVRWSDDLIFIIHFTDRVGVWDTLATRIWEVLSSILGRDIGHLDLGFSLFSSVPAGNSRNSASVSLRPLPLKFFPIHRPSIIQQ
jgi:hypothetical protein